MMGIYLHIPFCKQACHYCNFHFSTSLKFKDDLLECMHKEILMRSKVLGQYDISSIYFGGGTPSLLSIIDIEKLLNKLSNQFTISSNIEITLETNPDDMNTEYLKSLYCVGVNRLSVGIQSFHEEDLKYMNRAHTAQESLTALQKAKDVGFENLSIDLIYGGHTTSNNMWESNIEKAMLFRPNHISTYCMTIEDNTAFGSWIKKGKLQPIDEKKANAQYEVLQQRLKGDGYVHYEISNFGLEGHLATHNTSYWKGLPYMGIGPSAHSFIGNVRSWNVSNNAKYMKAISGNEIPATEEILTKADQFNEKIMTGLRTMWGVSLIDLQSEFGDEYYNHINNALMDSWLKDKLIISDGVVKLNAMGKNFADRIASQLFYDA